MRRVLLATAAAALLIGLLAVPAAAQVDGGRCGELFPDVQFTHSTSAGPVPVHGFEVPEGILDRYGRDWAQLVDWIVAEMGGLDESVAVCVFQDDIPLDAQALGWPEGQALRAVAFGEDGIVVLSNWFPANVPDAGFNGLIHVAQHRVSGGDYPEPFGTEVKGWYRNRLDRSVEVVHNFFVRQNSGLAEPWAPFPWTVGRLVDPILWNPEFGYGGGGDFANFAVANGDDTVLSDPLASNLETLDDEWRQALFDESGAIPGGSRGWVTGLSVAVAVLAVGVFMPWWSRRQKKRFEKQLRDLPWLEEQSRIAREREAVRTSIATGGGSGDPRVGRSGSATAVVDRDEGDGPPTGGSGRSRRDRMSSRGQPGDDLFRHPGFDDEE